MPTQRLSMRRIRHLLTMHFGAGASTRAIARELGISPSTAREYIGRVAAAGITWPLDPDMTGEALMGRLFVNGGVRLGARFHAEPDWAVLARELKRPRVQPDDPVGGVSRCLPRGLRLQPLLRAVPGVRASAVAHDAPAARGRAQGVSSTTPASACRSSTRVLASRAWRRSSWPCSAPPV